MDEDSEGIGFEEEEEELLPSTRAVLGLKVKGEREAATVRAVSRAVAALALLMVIHFAIHLSRSGDLNHAFGHLVGSFLLPVAGYAAVFRRSTAWAWLFHALTIVFVVAHAFLFAAVLHKIHDLEVEAGAAECAAHARACAGEALGTARGAWSLDRLVWRCRDGPCLPGSSRCDGDVQCFDASDEAGCSDSERVLDHPKILGRSWARLHRCATVNRALDHAEHLRLAWWLVSAPLIAICWFAGYHGLEFYVQLRLQRLGARVEDRDSGCATVFERGVEPGAGEEIDGVIAE